MAICAPPSRGVAWLSLSLSIVISRLWQQWHWAGEKWISPIVWRMEQKSCLLGWAGEASSESVRCNALGDVLTQARQWRQRRKIDSEGARRWNGQDLLTRYERVLLLYTKSCSVLTETLLLLKKFSTSERNKQLSLWCQVTTVGVALPLFWCQEARRKMKVVDRWVLVASLTNESPRSSPFQWWQMETSRYCRRS